MVTRFIVVRHCQSEGNAEARFQGRTEAAVSELGKKQAELVALRFRNEQIDALYTSPLTRARYTAERINQYHRLPLQLCDALVEIDVGELENKPLREIAAYRELAQLWDHTPDLCEFPGGETMRQVYGRVSAVIEAIAAEKPGKTVLLVAHGVVIRNLQAYALGGLEKIREANVVGNTSVTVLDHAAPGEMTVVTQSDCSHLPEELHQFTSYVITEAESAGTV